MVRTDGGGTDDADGTDVGDGTDDGDGVRGKGVERPDAVQRRGEGAPRRGFSWLAYLAGCWVGTLAGGMIAVVGPPALRAVASVLADGPGALSGPGGALVPVIPVTLAASTLLAVVAAVGLSPIALPLAATLHRRAELTRRVAIAGGIAMAALAGAMFVGLSVLRLDAAPPMAGELALFLLAVSVVPGALAGLTYRAIARRRGRS